MDRRQVLGTLAVAGAALTTQAATANAADGARPPGGKDPGPLFVPGQPFVPGQHKVVPLRLDPKKLRGLSERMITSHHENNYAGAVQNLNKVEQQLAQTTKDTPAFVVHGLRERELTYANSKVLHELYFGNLGGDGKAAGDIERALATTFGGVARFEEQFRAVGAALGGGSGWVVLDYSLHLGELRIAWAGSHTQTLATGVPLLVLDMYEHAYQLDYGAAAAKYLDAFFQNVDWHEVDRRWDRARKAHAALVG